MRAPPIAGLAGIGFAIGGFAMPVALPKLDPIVGQGILLVAALFLLASLGLWLWERRKSQSLSAVPTIPDQPTPARLDGVKPMTDNRKGNFVDGSPSGRVQQNYYEGPQQRTLSDEFVRAVATTADGSVTIQVRVYGPDQEMQAFGSSLLSNLQKAGFNACAFGADGGTRNFAGVRVEYAPNEASKAVGEAIAKALSAENLRTEVSIEDVWKDQNFVRVAVGGNVQ